MALDKNFLELYLREKDCVLFIKEQHEITPAQAGYFLDILYRAIDDAQVIAYQMTNEIQNERLQNAKDNVGTILKTLLSE